MPILLSSEAGAEGRNFQFCDRMVHYDLPFDPVELEQRIGRLDRIGRVKPVEIVYFRQSGAEPDVAGLFERLGLFERAAAGLDLALASVAPAIEAAAAAGTPLDADALVARVRAARETVESDIASVFYRDGYTPDQAASVMARVPEDLEIKTAAYCRGAARDLGFDVVDKGGEALCYIEFGAGAKVDSLPGVAGGSRFLGTFDRAEAVTREEVDFFASGHPLVEGLLLELEDGLRGRAALMEVPSGEVEEVEGAGLLCIYKRGPDWRAAVVSADGTLRPTWAAPLLAALPGAKKVDPQQWGIGDGWAEGIRALAACAEGEVEGAEIVAAAFFRTV